MLSAAGQAFRDMFTPPFRAVLFKCVGFTIALLALLIVGIEWTFSYFVQWPDWIETSIEWLGGLALVVGSIFLIPPVTSLIAGLYLDDIAALVEREHYPDDPPGRELPTLQSVGVALRLLLRRAAGEPRRSVPALDPRRQSDRLLSRQRLSAGAGIFRARGDATLAAGRGEELAASKPADCVLVWARHRRNRLGADPEPDHADLRHRLHGARVQEPRAQRRAQVALGAGVFGL